MYHLLNQIAIFFLPTWAYERLIGRWNSHGLKRYLNNTIWALVARAVNILVSFVVTIYLVRYLGPENYGQLSYSVSFIGLFAIISTLGIENVLYRDLVKYPEQRNSYLGTAFVIRVIAGIGAGLAAVTVGLMANPDDVSRLVIILLSCTFVFSSFNIIATEFQANVAQKYPSIVTVIVSLLLNLLKVVVVVMNEGVLYIAVILLLEPILYAIFFTYIRIRHYGSFRNWRFDRQVAKQLLIDSWPFIFITAFMTLYIRIDQIMLKHLLDSAAVGIYDAAVRVAEAWLFIPALIVLSIFPAIVNAKEIGISEYRTRLLTLAGTFIGLAALVALPLSLLAKPLMEFLYGPAFLGSAAVFAVYTWVSVFVVIDYVTRNFLIVENKRSIIFFITLATALINTGLNFIFIPLWGPAGAAWSTLIAYSVFLLPLFMIWKLK